MGYVTNAWIMRGSKTYQWMKHTVIARSVSDLNHDFLITQIQPTALDNCG